MRKWKEQIVIYLAYCNRYGFPISAGIMPFFIADSYRERYFLWGVLFLICALYNIIAVWFKWKHMYCALQNLSHDVMTPDRINWGKLSFREKYNPAIGDGVISLFAFGCYFLKVFNII